MNNFSRMMRRTCNKETNVMNAPNETATKEYNREHVNNNEHVHL